MNLSAPIFTHDEAAAFLKISTVTLSKIAVRDGIPRRKVGREWRYLYADLVAYVGGNRPAMPPPAASLVPASPLVPSAPAEPVAGSGRLVHHRRPIFTLTGGRR